MSDTAAPTTPASAAPVADAPVTAPSAAEVTSSPDAPADGGGDPYVKRLRDENAKWRQEAQRYAAFKDMAPEDFQVFQRFAAAYTAGDDAAAAAIFAPYVDRYGRVQDPSQGAPLNPETGDERPLTATEFRKLLDEQRAQDRQAFEAQLRAQERQRIETEAFAAMEAAGYRNYQSGPPPADAPLSEMAAWIDSQTVYRIAAATGMPIADAIEMHKRISSERISGFVTERAEQARNGVPLSPVTGLPQAGQRQAPQGDTFKERQANWLAANPR